MFHNYFSILLFLQNFTKKNKKFSEIAFYLFLKYKFYKKCHLLWFFFKYVC